MPNQQKTINLKGVIAYAIATAFLLYEMAMQSSPSVMAGNIMRDLVLNPSIFGMTIGAYFYSYTAMQIPVGLLFDRFSPRLLLLFAIIICVLGQSLFSISHGAGELALARLLLGFGSAFAFVAVLVVANYWFAERHFALLVGIAQCFAAIGAMSGELPIAALTNHTSWRQASLICAVFGIALAILVMFFIQRDKPTSAHQSKSSIRQSLAAIFSNKQTLFVGLYAFSSWAPIALFAELWGVPYMMKRFSITNVTASLCTGLIWVMLAASSPLLGWLSSRFGNMRQLLTTCSLIGLITSISLLLITPNWLWLNALLLSGLGIAGAGQILTFELVRKNNTPSHLATAIGINNMAVVIGGALFQPLVGYVLHWHAHQDSSVLSSYHVADYTMALLSIPLCYLIGFITSCFCIRT